MWALADPAGWLLPAMASAPDGAGPGGTLPAEILDTLRRNPGWVAAGLATLAFIFKTMLQEWAKRVAGALGDAAHRLWSGSRLLQRGPLRRYRQALLDKYATVPLPTSMDLKLQMRDIYVPLQAADGQDATAPGDHVDAQAVIDSTQRVMVIGPPGSGKSMLLRHTVLLHVRDRPDGEDRGAGAGQRRQMVARGRAGASAGRARQLLPVLVELRRMKPDRSLEEHLSRQLAEDGFRHNQRFLERALAAGKLLVLLDGLDEIPAADGGRAHAIDEIRAFIVRNPGCRLVVTCRSAVYRGELRDEVTRTFQVAQFTDQLIRRFLYRWPDMTANRVEQLLRALRDAPRMMALARNPLLLTIIAYLYTGGRRLPQSRAEFYRKTTEELLDRWKEQRNQFSGADKHAVLRRLALLNLTSAGARGEDRLSIEVHRARAQVAEILPSLGLDTGQASLMLTEIVERSGLLLLIDGGERYQFAHLTLQEYFAAEALGNDWPALLQRYVLDPDTWREPLLLWCGGTRDSTALIRDLYEKDPVLAFECLADAREVDQWLASMILSSFQDRLRNGEVDDKVVLAFGSVASDDRPGSRGRAVFDFLAWAASGVPRTPQRTAAVRALAATNLERAARVLATLPHRSDDGILEVLVGMGDVAVPVLAQPAAEGDEEALDGLRLIGTPAAALALVPLLWRDEPTATKAAWRVAALLADTAVQAELRGCPLPPGSQTAPRLDWVWEPFAATSGALAPIASRTAFLIGQERALPLAPQGCSVDPRIAVPLGAVGASLEGLSAGFLRKEVEEFEHWFRSELPQLGRQRFADERERLAALIRYDPGGNEQLAHHQELVTAALLDGARLKEPQEFFLRLLPGPVRREVVARLLLGPTPTTAHWRNVRNPMRFSFQGSPHFRLTELLVTTLAAVALWQLWLALHGHQTGLLRWLPWLEGAAILAGAAVVAMFHLGSDPAGRGEPGAPEVLGWLALGPVVGLVLIVVALDDRDSDSLVFVAFGVAALLAMPSVVVRDTIAFHHWTGSWPATAAVWLSLGALLGSLVLTGRRKERLARNPLEGLQLDATSPR